MSDNLNPQSLKQLLGLPSEVRLLIYEELFAPCTINTHATREHPQKDLKGAYTRGNAAAILATCRTIYTEAKPVLYDNTEFHVTLARDSADAILRELQLVHSLSDDSPSHDTVLARFPDLSWTPGQFRFAAREHGIKLRESYLKEPLKPLFSLARKISLSILFTESNVWEWTGEGDRWLRYLPVKLAELCEAPELKTLHLTFEAKHRPFLRSEFNHVLGLLGDLKPRASVTLTAAVAQSISATDCHLEPYTDTLAKLKW